jgi:hypothetical protein
VFDAVVSNLAIAESFILDGEMLLYNTLDETFEEFGTLLSGFKAAASDKLTRITVAGAGEVGDQKASVDKDGRMMLDPGTKWADLQIWCERRSHANPLAANITAGASAVRWVAHQLGYSLRCNIVGYRPCWLTTHRSSYDRVLHTQLS